MSVFLPEDGSPAKDNSDSLELLTSPLLGHSGQSRGGDMSGEVQTLQNRISSAVKWSLAANIALLVAKLIAFYFSRSMAVAASALDSLVDLASQGIVAFADYKMSIPSPKYPAGRSRLESVSVLACAYVMTVGALEVIRESSLQLYDGFSHGNIPKIDMSALMYTILAIATLMKIILYFYCSALKAHSGAALALAEDHLNDVASNLAAIATAAAASYRHADNRWWWADPLGGIVISIYIVTAWIRITMNQIRKIVGESAPEETLNRLRALAQSHHPSCRVAFLRAYHAGQKLQVDVELESVSSHSMTVREASAVALSLKRVLESVPEVESAAVVVVVNPDDGIAAGQDRSTTTMSHPLVLPSGKHHPLIGPSLGTRLHAHSIDVQQHEAQLMSHFDGSSWDPAISSYESSPRGTGNEGSPTQQQQEQHPDYNQYTMDDEEMGRGNGGCSNLPQLGPRRLHSSADLLLHQRHRRGAGGGDMGGSSLAEHLVWSRCLRDPPEAALRSATFVGHGSLRDDERH